MARTECTATATKTAIVTAVAATVATVIKKANSNSTYIMRGVEKRRRLMDGRNELYEGQEQGKNIKKRK